MGTYLLFGIYAYFIIIYITIVSHICGFHSKLDKENSWEGKFSREGLVFMELVDDSKALQRLPQESVSFEPPHSTLPPHHSRLWGVWKSF